MLKKKNILVVSLFLLLFLCACAKKKKEGNDVEVTPAEKQNPFVQDLLCLKTELPKLHMNLFFQTSEEEYNRLIDSFIERADQLNEDEQRAAIMQIVASIGDAHTNTAYIDGYVYPFSFAVLQGDVYIINTTEEFRELMFSKVTAIDGVAMETVVEKLSTLYAYENKAWRISRIPEFLRCPSNLYGLDLVKERLKASFTLEKEGVSQTMEVKALFHLRVKMINDVTPDVLLDRYQNNYEFSYIEDSKALYFQYNVCRDSVEVFTDFNNRMFECIESTKPERIIMDVRNNRGGSSLIIEPFAERMQAYAKDHPEVKVFILSGRNSFSGGSYAIFQVRDVVPQALIVGEATGGALSFFAEIKQLLLPQSQMVVSYSTKYFDFTTGFAYKNKGVDTCEPDVLVQPAIEDYRDGNDPVLQYALIK